MNLINHWLDVEKGQNYQYLVNTFLLPDENVPGIFVTYLHVSYVINMSHWVSKLRILFIPTGLIMVLLNLSVIGLHL